MRNKGDFIGLTLKEERALIELIVHALGRLPNLTSDEQYIVKKSFDVIAKNQEFKKGTFNKLTSILYRKLHLEPIQTHDYERGPGSGSWYIIPSSNIVLASKRLKNRLKKRRRYIDESWWEHFNESFDWESYDSKEMEERKTQARKAIEEILGPDGIKEISDDRDPRNVVMFPDKKRS